MAKKVVETQEMLVQRTMSAITNRTTQLTAQKNGALSAFRTAANQLAVVNEGLAETAKVSSEMVAFFAGYQQDTESAIADNEAVRQRILDIIGE